MSKCNVDAGVFAEQISFGVGMCLRNQHGQFVKTKTIYQGILHPLEAKTWAL